MSNSGSLNTVGEAEYYYYDGGRIIEIHRPMPVTTRTTYTCGGPGGGILGRR